MQRLKSAFLLFVLFTILKGAISQLPENTLEQIRAEYASEKIFIHYDKENYVAGETIWFKVYLLSGFFPSMLSSSISVELLNDSGKIMERKILPVINSAAKGNFELSRDAMQRNYQIRAYTMRSVNFGSKNFYHHRFAVLNPSLVQKNESPANEFMIHFLPEGGNFIRGIKNIIAFKCSDQWGYPADAEGTIRNSTGATVATFASVHDGMGKFEITPVNGETYTADCMLGKTLVKKVSLPASNASGSSLNIQKTNGKTYFVINSETVTDENLQPAYVLGVMEDAMVFKTPLPPGQKNFKGLIPVSDIASGILQVTLFTNSHQPLAERLIFIYNEDYIARGRFTAETVSTADYAKNVYSFELADSLNGSFSVAVSDVSKEIKINGTDNIVSRFLLTNDIKGYVHNPSYYFETADEERKLKLDLVMLTNGWRKFNWKELLSSKLPVISYRDPNFISLKGLAYNGDNNKLLDETNLTVFIRTKDSANDMMIVPVEKNGSFEISGLVFDDTATLFFQNMQAKNKKTFIQLTSIPVSRMMNVGSQGRISIRPLTFSEENPVAKNLYGRVLQSPDKNAILLNEIQLISQGKSPQKLLEERYIRNGVFNTYAANTIDLVNNSRGISNVSNVFEYLKGRLNSVIITGSGSNYFLNYRNTSSLLGGQIPMALFLDEVQVNSTMEIAMIPLSQIAMIKLYSAGFVATEGGGAGGALAIYRKKGEDTYNVPGMENMFRLKLEGYSPVKEFFSPDYSSGKPMSQAKDFRSTLYWDPNLQTDPLNKKITFSFFNASQVKKFKVVLEGMTEDGKLVHVEKFIE